MRTYRWRKIYKANGFKKTNEIIPNRTWTNKEGTWNNVHVGDNWYMMVQLQRYREMITMKKAFDRLEELLK